MVLRNATPFLTHLFNAIFLTAPVISIANISVQFEINTTKNIHPISPYIYGSNSDELTDKEGVTFRRSGGNRLTGYNWENNASNAGTDWQNSSDSYLGGGDVPAKAITDFIDKNNQTATASLITLPAAGYVAKDKNGSVAPSEVAPSKRWAKVVFEKGNPFSLTPSVDDGEVYTDEFIHFLVNRYGKSSQKNGVKFYSVDNEPGIWKDTHPYLHPLPATGAELVQKTIGTAKAVKQLDPDAEIFGGVFFGYYDLALLANTADWNAIKAGKNYSWFVDYFLDEMKKASDKIGYRLLDVVDIHWYAEARGDHRINDANATTNKDRAARLQAPRSLWDSTYAEDSWISKTQTPKQPVLDWNNPTPGPILLLPRLMASIQKYYPGTKLAITEYNYGEANHITGALAGVDYLGILGREQIYAASFWQLAEKPTALKMAFQLYRNFDGNFSTFPSTSVYTKSSDDENSSVYAGINSQNGKMHVIVINKSSVDSLAGNFKVTSVSTFISGKAFGFDAADTAITEKKSVSISGNAFNYSLPPLSSRHFILDTQSSTKAKRQADNLMPSSLKTQGGAPFNFNDRTYWLNGKLMSIKAGTLIRSQL